MPTRQVQLRHALPDASDWEREMIERCEPFTMTGPERLLALSRAVRYLVENRIAGDIVECGVWRGGSILAAVETLIACGETSRSIWLYDTFRGMTEPGEGDIDWRGHAARDLMERDERGDPQGVWCWSELQQVQDLLGSTNYPRAKFRYIVGDVCRTLPSDVPSQIALLRLDTDFYDSTMLELIHLYPLLEVGGVLIVDDYGHWQGCKKAVDEYFAKQSRRILLNRVDYTCRIAVKA